MVADPAATALFVVDVQNGFVNRHSARVLSPVGRLVDGWLDSGAPVVFTRYENRPGSPFERLLGARRFRAAPETDLHEELRERVQRAAAVLTKHTYTCFTDDALALIRERGWRELVFCGIATESCVLTCATAAFDHGLVPWLVPDACASHAGPELHAAGLKVAARLIGAGQLLTVEGALERVRGGRGESATA
ncbi:isochorismatase family cysteine hydrolase [Streptomyces sp. ODS28]|uniref:isochorismatase family cysteine hydrolase n=1 Tax=Streptomyces sp. ODS28 TaxID=3136688 RepID=UPI0031F0E18B